MLIIYTYIKVQVCICIYIYIYIYTHTQKTSNRAHATVPACAQVGTDADACILVRRAVCAPRIHTYMHMFRQVVVYVDAYNPCSAVAPLQKHPHVDK